MDPLRRRTQELLRNPHAVHQELYSAVSTQPVRERVLWRWEAPEGQGLHLLVLTDSLPSWEPLALQCGWTDAGRGQAQVRAYEPLLDKIEPGRTFAFRLRANPVSATRHPESPTAAQRAHLATARPRGVRVAHRTASGQLQWLREKVTSWGFDLETTAAGDADVVLTGREQIEFRKGLRGKEAPGNRVTLTTATFTGRWSVRDPGRARASLVLGVGGARAYGCGLITLAPTTPVS